METSLFPSQLWWFQTKGVTQSAYSTAPRGYMVITGGTVILHVLCHCWVAVNVFIDTTTQVSSVPCALCSTWANALFIN